MEWLASYYDSKYMCFIKYLVSIVLTLFTFKMTGNPLIVFAGFLELVIIFGLTNLVFKWYPKTAYVLNSLLVFFFNLEQVILLFGGTYLSLIMLSNVGSLSSLSGEIAHYLVIGIPVLLTSFLPVRRYHCQLEIETVVLFLVMVINIALIGSKTVETAPLYNYYVVANEKFAQLKLKEEISGKSSEKVGQFYQPEVLDSRQKPQNLPEKPNVIVIFTEGLSQHIIDDSRNFMPHLSAFQHKALRFENYFNHTFATYRGLIGQLYSGYQFDNYDQNHLISLQGILKQKGYQTTFINTEPYNSQFTKYLQGMDFESLVSRVQDEQGIKQDLSDKEAYNLLWKTINEFENDTPFMVGMYTYGTHVSFDSRDEVYASGNDPMLNKFYDLDFQFGAFLKKFESSPLSKNTMIVFTTDHATYVDDSYLATFSDYHRDFGSLDRVPLFIYYKGIQPQTIDVKGRNSLDLAPTILDYIDVSEPNYFLGTSLFADTPRTNASYLFNSEMNVLTTYQAEITKPNDEELGIYFELLRDYFSANQK